ELKHMQKIVDGDDPECSESQMEGEDEEQRMSREKKFQCVSEGVAKLFKAPPGRPRPIRTVMTKGVAGIGKTLLTHKFTVDWAEDKAQQEVHFTFPLTFRELNVLRGRSFSLVGLVDHFFSGSKEAGICSFQDFLVLFILDGLDECRLPLDFLSTQTLTDVSESTSVEVLLINLIRGELLPSALLWITTRPAAANQIPPEFVDMVTEVRGFTDLQKDEYFRRKSTDKEQVIKMVKFDGGAATDPHWSPQSRKMIESLGKLAFEQLQKGKLIFYESDLTECGMDLRAASVCSGVFTQVFIEESSLYQDTVFTFIHLSLQEFLAALHVHQTFISSKVNLLEHQPQNKSWMLLFQKPILNLLHSGGQPDLNLLHQSAVDEALRSPNGHLDLFLRFLLGLSLPTNQRLLQGLLTQTGSDSQTNQRTVKYIKEKLSESLSTERSINLFHCLNEVNDHSLLEQIQESMRSGSLSTEELSPAQWSALVFILLSSQEHLDSSSVKHLDLSNNDLQDSGVKLLCEGLKSPHCKLDSLRSVDHIFHQHCPVPGLLTCFLSCGCFSESSLSGCVITKVGGASLAAALSSNSSSVRDLDLSYNHPGDSAVKLLSQRLNTLR
uniref:NACHT domain-containing protein n=1 Tax=Gouania willdenowi TaxID=441366 RepID=A0A8C5ELK3_GOUWI